MDQPCAVIAAVDGRQVLNSHVEWTIEFTVRLADGSVGRGASPRGETPSIYEDRPRPGFRADVASEVARSLVGLEWDQVALDDVLAQRRAEWGAPAVYAISVAFYEATRRAAPGAAPRILFNLLNGGLHAYTNPITADVTEFLLVPRSDDLEATIAGYSQLLRDARRALAEIPTREVGGNRVHDLGAEPNVAAFALVEELLQRAALTDLFGIMIDASAGDWYDGDRYRLPITERTLEPGQLVDEWLGLMDRFELMILEDPFAETDVTAWQRLHEARPARCGLYGDNLTSTQPEELEAKVHLVDGVLIKPDQNGTVSGTLRFADAARRAGLRLAASHRSIETDSPFLVHLAADVGVDYTKIGPYSDFSSVMRTNTMLREARA